jgi:two-component system sensor histidine kinase ChiS
MKRYSHRKYKQPFCWILLSITYLMASCSSPAIIPEDQASLEISDSTPANQTSEISSPQLKLTAGQDLRFENISLEEGLSQSTVFSIIQDQRGFLWFGTEDGLNKYDGYSFTVYKADLDSSNSLLSNWIDVIYEDDDGMLWIGTSGGLDRFDPWRETFTHFQHNPEDDKSLSANHITALLQDHEGMLWIGTLDGGINKLDLETEQIVYYQEDPRDQDSISSNGITSVYEDEFGILFVGTANGGLNVYNREENIWLSFLPDSSNPTSISHRHVSSITGNGSGLLWIGTEGGGLNKLILSSSQREDLASGSFQNSPDLQFQHYQHDPNEYSSLSSNDISSLYSDYEGMLWIGTKTTGLNLLTPEEDEFVHYQNNPGNPDSLSHNWIPSIYQDREGVYWFGTIGAGVDKLNLGWRNFLLYRNIPGKQNSLNDEMVRTFHIDQDSLWIGTMFGGLNRLDRPSGNWTHYLNDPDDSSSLSSNFVSDIIQDESGIIWVATSTSLERIDPEKGDISHILPKPQAPRESPENNIRAIYEYSPGVLWVGTRAGLFSYDLGHDQWDQIILNDDLDSHSLDTDWILSILEDQQGMIWITTWGSGVFKVNPTSDEYKHYHFEPDEPNGLSSNDALSILQSQSGIFWISSTNGLNRFDPETETFIHYQEKDGLPNNTANCTLEDSSGDIWVSTNKGLARFDPKDEIFYSYNVNDGLQSNEFNGNACYASENGELYFGGIKGFNVIYPDLIQTNSYRPPIVLTSFTHDGRKTDPITIQQDGGEIRLKWPDNAFEFEYAALSFNQPDKNQYAFYLEGFDKDWNEVDTRRYGQYTNLPGGTYTLHIIGSNNDGVWNEAGISVEITVVPPIWGTWWFRGLIIAAIVGASYGGFKLRVRNLEKRGRELEIQVKDRTDQLMEVETALRETDLEKAVIEERNRLARELHDSVTQSLYSLTLFTEAARHLAEEAKIEKLEGFLGQIGNLGLQALKEMRLLVFELGLHALEEDDVVEALKKRLAAVESRTGVEANVVVKDFKKQSPFIETQLFKIAQEALNNALKHAEASNVEVSFNQAGNVIEMEVVDDGVGFDPDSLSDSPGMGLKNISDRVKLLGGKLEINSTPGEGTRLKVLIRTDGAAI